MLHHSKFSGGISPVFGYQADMLAQRFVAGPRSTPARGFHGGSGGPQNEAASVGVATRRNILSAGSVVAKRLHPAHNPFKFSFEMTRLREEVRQSRKAWWPSATALTRHAKAICGDDISEANSPRYSGSGAERLEDSPKLSGFGQDLGCPRGSQDRSREYLPLPHGAYPAFARRAATPLWFPGAGVDADEKVVYAAQDAGVPIRLHCLRITRESLPALTEILSVARARAIVARRILPELWGDDLEGGRQFADSIAEAGVKEVFLEGRVVSERATNPLRSIDDEVELLSSRYREVKRAKALSYLVLR